jgi:hypothetical protein
VSLQVRLRCGSWQLNGLALPTTVYAAVADVEDNLLDAAARRISKTSHPLLHRCTKVVARSKLLLEGPVYPRDEAIAFARSPLGAGVKRLQEGT